MGNCGKGMLRLLKDIAEIMYMRYLTKIGLIILVTVYNSVSVAFCSSFFWGKQDTISLSAREVEKGWELLFDGKYPAKQWRAIGKSEFPESGWLVENGDLVLLPGRKGGDIITRDTFSNFELILDFMLSKNTNTGIKYFVAPLVTDKGKTELNGPEYQLIDDDNHPSVKDNKSPKTSTGSVYLLYAPNKAKFLNPIGEWNRARIVARGKRVEHWLNGKRILSYKRGSKKFRELIADTKFKVYKPGYAEAEYGHILLQDHNDSARFRNIRIRRLKL